MASAGFIPLAAVFVLAMIFFGKTRARLCALMIFLVVALGDPLIINTIEETVGAPAPVSHAADTRGLSAFRPKVMSRQKLTKAA